MQLQARDDLGHGAVAQADADGVADGFSVLNCDAKVFALFGHDGRYWDRQNVGVLFGDDGRIGIEAGLELRFGVGDVDLDAERAHLGVKSPGDAGDLRLDELALDGLKLDGRAIAGVDRGGEHWGRRRRSSGRRLLQP